MLHISPRHAAAALVAACLVAPAALAQPPRVSEDARLVADFGRRALEYAELHRKLEATLPGRPPNPSPAQVDAHQRSLTRLVAQARRQAQHGDLFTREIRAYFRRQIARALSGPDAGLVRASIMDENPGRIQLRINGPYPDEIPLSTMPPQLLAALPGVPEELEYRFIGDRLILLDIHANLVVDYIDDALPK